MNDNNDELRRRRRDGPPPPPQSSLSRRDGWASSPTAAAALKSVRNLGQSLGVVVEGGPMTAAAASAAASVRSATWDVRLSSTRRSVVGGRMVPTFRGVVRSAGGPIMTGRGFRRRVRVEVAIRPSSSALVGSPSPMRPSSLVEPSGAGVSAHKVLFASVTAGEASVPTAPLASSVGTGDGSSSMQAAAADSGASLARSVEGAAADEEVDVVVRVLKPVRSKSSSTQAKAKRRFMGSSGMVGIPEDGDDGQDLPSDDDSEAMSVASTDTSATTGRRRVETDPDSGEVWKEKYRVPLDTLTVSRADLRGGRSCCVTIGTGPDRKERKVIFADDAECASFRRTIDAVREAVRFRTRESLERALELRRSGVRDAANGHGAPADDAAPDSAVAESGAHQPANLLIEIVSAKDLRDADVGGKSDPFVEIRLGHRVLHRTCHIDNDLDPIYTLEDGSFFLVTDSMEEFFSAAPAVTFEVKDYDAVGKNESLGSASVKQSRLLAMQGERVALPLEMIKSSKKQQGTLFVRCRRATESDLRFMEKLRAEKSLRKRRGVACQSKFVSPIVPPTKFSAMRTLKKEVDVGTDMINGDGEGKLRGDANGHGGQLKEKLYRVRPMPDPVAEQGSENNKWMTKAEIERATYEPSRSWIEAGTGKAGRVYVEILGCDGLPNMDKGINRNNKTDTFVMAIFEDAIVSTDVVADCLSPRFLPWTRRAIEFKVSHPTSQLLLGVYDLDNIPLNDHDAIGRCTVSLSTFRPGTEYVLTYRLFDTAVWPKRKQFGTITIRLVLDWNDDYKLFTDSITSPSRFYVNVQDKKNFVASYNTIEGSKDVYAYSIETMTEQVNELTETFFVAFDVYDAIVHVIFWRGHFHVKLGTNEFDLPLHSMIAFASGILLVEKPWLAPAIFTASVGWIMLALLERRLNRPSPWARPPSYGEMLRSYATGNRMAPQCIAANENAADDEEYVERAKEMRSKAQDHVMKLYNEKMKEWEEMAAIMGEGGDLEDLTSRKKESFSKVPFRSTLYPYQVWFDQLCHMKRFVGYVLSWEHYFLSFWITTASFGLGFIFLFIPWRFLCIWTGRLFVWVGLGPWMKLLDSKKVVSKREERKREKERLRQKDEAFQGTMEQLQIQKENAVKLSAMKKHVFGRFIVSVPHLFKLDRYRDEPLPSSTAKPIPPDETLESKIDDSMKTTCLGQRLHGEMIPADVNMHFDLSGSAEDEINTKLKAANNRLAFITGKKVN